MDIQKALTVPSLANAKVVAGKSGLTNEVTGIMVLEAVDIENWGRKGEIILTSFFALRGFSETEIETFLEKLSAIGISAIIVKIERLLLKIPPSLVAYCNRRALPLIQIPKDVKYEAVILDILGPIVDANLALLNHYYEVHNALTKLALEEPSVEQILQKLKAMIGCDLTLYNRTDDEKTGTSPARDAFHTQRRAPLPAKQYRNFPYYDCEVSYEDAGPDQRFRQIAVPVPNRGKAQYELVIHLRDRQIHRQDFMVIENAVSFLQMELLRRYAVEQTLFHRSNNLVNDLLNGRLYGESKVEEVLRLLHLDRAPLYRVLLVQLFPAQQNAPASIGWAADILYALRAQCRKRWPEIAFLEKEERITFLHNYNAGAETFTPQSVRQLLSGIQALSHLPPFRYQAALSTAAGRYEIPRVNQEALDAQKILYLFHRPNSVLPYEELGVYKLFLVAEASENLESFLPPRLVAFRKKYPELMETLHAFLDANQNLSETAKRLYLHPKTVRYRLDKLQSLLDFDFTDAEQILQLQMFSRLSKLAR